jgi:RNA polymerase sigma-70 factor (ECF subfamily)
MQTRTDFNVAGPANRPPELPKFDSWYIERLRAGTADVEEHFTSYFEPLLNAVLRNRLRCPDLINDVRQETITRVLACVQLGQVHNPERFGSFVLGVCRRVQFEYLRRQTRNSNTQSEQEELVYGGANPHEEAATNERKQWVARVLRRLPSKDRQVLEMIYLEGMSRSEVCMRLGIKRDCFSVVLHRAKSRFRKRLALPVDHTSSKPECPRLFTVFSIETSKVS